MNTIQLKKRPRWKRVLLAYPFFLSVLRIGVSNIPFYRRFKVARMSVINYIRL